MGIGLATRLLLPNMKGMSLEITEELIARQTPEAQAIIRAPEGVQQLYQDGLLPAGLPQRRTTTW